MRSVKAGVGLVLTLLSGALAGSALAESGPLSLEAWGSFVSLSGTTTVDEAYGVKVAFDNGWGAGLGVSYAISPLLSAGISVSYEKTKGRLDVAGGKALDLGCLRMVPVSALLRLHPVRGGNVDPWVGAGGAFVSFSDLSSDDLSAAGLGNVEVKSKAAFLLDAGIGLRIVRGLDVFVSGRYMPLKPTSRGASGSDQELKLNPLSVSAGVRLGL